MASNFNNDSGTGYVVADGFSVIGAGNKVVQSKTVTINVVDGAAAGTFSLPAGSVITSAHEETPVAIPGTPTNTNLRLGSTANGAQYVADVDVKAQGFPLLTLLYPARNPATTIHYTVASTGGTAAAQDGTIYVHINYLAPQNL